jgi:hypothetical protein
MNTRKLALLSVFVVTTLLLAFNFSGIASAKRIPGAEQGGRPLTATLTGAAEVPGPGDPDGSGWALITLNQGQRQVCFKLTVENIAPATAAHIHRGTADVAGPVVVPLAAPTDGSSSGCVSADRELIKAIRQNPQNYYVNIHNAPYPAGAVRGQLSK